MIEIKQTQISAHDITKIAKTSLEITNESTLAIGTNFIRINPTRNSTSLKEG
jgi:hypothetical protein